MSVFYLPENYKFDLYAAVFYGKRFRERYGAYSGDATDPTGPVSGSSRVIRGGSAADYDIYCRSANRSSSPPDCCAGFRLALVPVK